MAVSEVKQEFIESFRTTPEGISEFLETPIPTPPTIGTPGDVDAAIIANGVAAKYILDLFNTYAGYTPIEGMLRIGQHNSVQEIAMLAGLQTRTAAPENDLEILEPTSGGKYLPGELRLRAQAANGTLVQCAAQIGDSPISLAADAEGVFEGYVELEDMGSYTAMFSGIFDDDEQATASVTFTIAEETDPEPGDPPIPEEEKPQPAGGKDTAAQSRAQKTLAAALRKFLTAKSAPAYAKAMWVYVKTCFFFWITILKKVVKGNALEALNQFIAEANNVMDLMEQALDGNDGDAIDREIGRFQALILSIAGVRN